MGSSSLEIISAYQKLLASNNSNTILDRVEDRQDISKEILSLKSELTTLLEKNKEKKISLTWEEVSELKSKFQELQESLKEQNIIISNPFESLDANGYVDTKLEKIESPLSHFLDQSQDILQQLDRLNEHDNKKVSINLEMLRQIHELVVGFVQRENRLIDATNNRVR